MNSKYKYLFKNMGILTLSNFASKILVFLLVPLYTSVLSTEEYGTYDLIVTTVQLLFPILTLNITDAVMRFLMDKSKNQKSVVTAGTKYISISIFIGALLTIIIHFQPWMTALHGLEIVIFLYYVFYILNQFFLQLAKGLERVNDMGVASVLGTVSMLAANVLFLLIFKWGLIGFFVANILAQGIPVLYYFVRIRVWHFVDKDKLDQELTKEMLQYCTPLIFTALGWWVNSAADRYTVALMVSVAANGVLSVSYKIPSVINTLQSIFTQAWQISAVKEYGKKDTMAFYGNAFTYLNLLMTFACAGLILLSRPLARILYANDFYQAWQYVPFLLVSSVVNAASGFIGPILSAKKDSKAMAWSAIYGAGANVVLNIAFVYFIGVQGATVATVISSIIIYQIRRNAAKDEFSTKQYKNIMLSWGLLIIQATLESYFRATLIEIVLILVCVHLYRIQIKQLINKLIKRN